MVALVAHDAGGAEIVSSYARRAGLSGVTSVRGPAQAIMSRKLPTWPDVPVTEAIAQCDWLLCGTSWQSDHELTASQAARRSGKPVVAYLDHWVGYPERFTLRGEAVMPDEIWVGDQYAERIASQIFPGSPIRNVGNPYLQDIQEELAERAARIGPSESGPVLYICEPIGEQALLQHNDAHYWGYTEDEALRYFFSRRAELGLSAASVVLRLHPSERPGKYDWALRQYGPNVTLGGSESLLDAIASSQAVAGCGSMAMVIALLAGKRVISTIPPGGDACPLPHDTIEILRDLP